MNEQDFEQLYTLKEGILFVVSGPSGAGKSVITQEYVKLHPDVLLSRSETTRPMRDNEVDGVDYNFISAEEFKRRADEGYYLEWAHKFGNSYGTPKTPIEETLRQNRCAILEIETQGAMQVKEAFPNAVFVFVLPPSLEALMERIESRKTETKEEIQKRMRDIREEVSCIPEYDYIIINEPGKLDEAVECFAQIVQAQKHSVKRILKQDRSKQNED